MEGTRTLRIAMGICWILGLVLLFVRPEVGLLCLFAAGMFALYLWLLGRQTALRDARWQEHQAHRAELLDQLEAEGVVTREEIAESATDRPAVWEARAADLRNLKHALDDGRLSHEEYETRRANLLGDL